MIMTTPSLETTIRHTTMASTLGELTLVRDADRIRGLYFPHHWHTPDTTSFGPPSDADFAETIAQIEQYLAGTLREFDLPLTPRVGPRPTDPLRRDHYLRGACDTSR